MAEEFDLSKPVSEVSREEIGELMKTRKYAGTASERDPKVVEYVTSWFREKYPSSAVADQHDQTDDQGDVDKKKGAAEQVLKEEWGDSYEQNIKLAQEAYGFIKAQFFNEDKELQTFFEKHGNNPALVKLFHRIGLDLQKNGEK